MKKNITQYVSVATGDGDYCYMKAFPEKENETQWSLWSGSDRSGPNRGVNHLHVSSHS